MIGDFKQKWEYTWNDIWIPLVDENEEATDDVYIELYRVAADKFKQKLTFERQSLIFNDKLLAKETFQKIRGGDFKDEEQVIIFFEETYEALEEYGIKSLQKDFNSLTASFLERYNLRYRLIDPFHLLVQLPWIYNDIYAELNQLNNRDTHLKELMDDFENAFSSFARDHKRRDLKASISKATNYVEAIATKRLKSDGGTLGEMCGKLKQENVWPHTKVQSTLQELYDFCSDYPGLRHGGSRKNKFRDLDIKDTIIISALLIAFSWLHY